MPFSSSSDVFSSFFYISNTPGIGGSIKCIPEDFIVSEIVGSNLRFDPRSTAFPSTSGRGLFLHCALIKRDWTTEDALDYLARFWHVPRKHLGFAGTKDKHALTAQRISVWEVKDRFEQGELKEVDIGSLKVHFLGLELTEVRLGDLLGNAFEITIRSIDRDETEVKDIVSSTLSQIESFHGLPNFFGLQRFGDVRPITHLVGKFLILNDIPEALRYYVGKTFSSEDPTVFKARKFFWDTGDAAEALKFFPSGFFTERKILSLLAKTNYDYQQVFHRFSLQFRKLFVHAYQSYLFNKYLHLRYYSFEPDFSQPLSGEKVLDSRVYAPLLGVNIKLEGETAEIYKIILKHERLNLDVFKNPLLKKLGFKGDYRTVLFQPKNFRLLECSEDELYPNRTKLTLSFDLNKGSYATVLLSELMKV